MAGTDLISLADAKAQLNKTTTTDDGEISLMITAASQFVEGRVGPCTPRQFVEVAEGDNDVLVLTNTPLISITSIVPQLPGLSPLAPADLAGLIVNATAGTVRRGYLAPFFGPQVVTYQAGRTSPPENVQLATRIIVQHLWDTQRTARSRPSSSPAGDEAVVPGFGYAVPSRALELLESSVMPLGFA